MITCHLQLLISSMIIILPLIYFLIYKYLQGLANCSFYFAISLFHYFTFSIEADRVMVSIIIATF